jgi:hypothetical protein
MKIYISTIITAGICGQLCSASHTGLTHTPQAATNQNTSYNNQQSTKQNNINDRHETGRLNITDFV